MRFLELHTEGDVELAERNIRTGSHSHTPITEKNDDTTWCIWAKPGESYGLKKNMTGGQQLNLSPLSAPVPTTRDTMRGLIEYAEKEAR